MSTQRQQHRIASAAVRCIQRQQRLAVTFDPGRTVDCDGNCVGHCIQESGDAQTYATCGADLSLLPLPCFCCCSLKLLLDTRANLSEGEPESCAAVLCWARYALRLVPWRRRSSVWHSTWLSTFLLD